MTFDPRAKKWKIFLRRQWLVFHCVSLRSLFYHCHAFRFLFWVQEFSRKSSTLPDFYWFCCRPINASRFKIRTSHSITSIRHWLVTWWITLFSLLSCREDKKSHQLVIIPRQDTLFWRSDSKKSGKEIVQKYRSTVETDPSIIYIIFGYKLYSSPKLGVDPKIYWVRYYGSFSVFYEIGTEWSSTESFSFADSSDAEQFFKFSALFWSALFCCASNRLFSSFAAIKSFSSTIEVSLCIELNRFFDLFRVFLGLNFI